MNEPVRWSPEPRLRNTGDPGAIAQAERIEVDFRRYEEFRQQGNDYEAGRIVYHYALFGWFGGAL